MDNETIRCRRLVKAMIMQNMKDMIMPFGSQNSRRTSRDAYDFLLNRDSDAYIDFCTWCDLADFNPEYWQKLALMNLACEINDKPWLKARVLRFMHGKSNWLLLKKYCSRSSNVNYLDFIRAVEDA